MGFENWKGFPVLKGALNFDPGTSILISSRHSSWYCFGLMDGVRPRKHLAGLLFFTTTRPCRVTTIELSQYVLTFRKRSPSYAREVNYLFELRSILFPVMLNHTVLFVFFFIPSSLYSRFRLDLRWSGQTWWKDK